LRGALIAETMKPTRFDSLPVAMCELIFLARNVSVGFE